MKKLSGIWPALVVAILAASPHAALAAFNRSIYVSGTSSGPGTCSITIEPFGARGGIQPSSVQTFNINVPIPNASSASNSATLIRNDVDTALPAEYTVTIPAGHPTFVDISRASGTFTMTISENVEGQTIQEGSPAPGLEWPAMLLLALGLLVTGAMWVRRMMPIRAWTRRRGGR
jgi:hypothetical protein